MKLLKVLISLLLVLVLIYTALTFYLGKLTEETMQRDLNELVAQNHFDLLDHQYNRGIFTAQETITLRMKQDKRYAWQKNLPGPLYTVLSEPVTIILDIQHGPFTSEGIARASMQAKFQWTATADKVIKQFFADRNPITMTEVLSLSGKGKRTFVINNFDYEELSGIRIVWHGLTGDLNYDANRHDTDWDMYSPGLEVLLADKGHAEYQDLRYFRHFGGDDILSEGNHRLTIGSLALLWTQQDKPYPDLMEMVWLIGTGNLPPSADVEIEDFAWSVDNQTKDNYADTNTEIGFSRLKMDKQEYGPLHLEVSAEHLNTLALNALMEKIAQNDDTGESQESWQARVLDAVQNEGAGLFGNAPKLTLNDIDFTMPQGSLKATGSLLFSAFEAPKEQYFSTLLKHAEAQLNYQVHQKVVEQFVLSRLKNLFASVHESPEQLQAELSETVHVWFDQWVRQLAQQDYLTFKNGILSGEITWSAEKLLMNNQPFKSSDTEQTDNLDNLMDENDSWEEEQEDYSTH